MNALASLYLRYGIKMGIACLLAWAFSYLIGSEYAVWAVVAAVVAMQLNVAESFQQGIQRITGTVLGAAVGVGALLATPEDPLILGLTVFGITVACGYLSRFSAVSAVTAIAAVVVLFTGSQHLGAGYMDAVTFGLMRVVEIAIGVGCAFFVSLILWPVRLVDTLRADLSLQFQESARLLDTVLNSFLTDQHPLPYSLLQHVEGKIWDNHERLNKARKHESLLYRYQHRVMKIQVSALDRTAESLRSMLEALNDYDEESRDPLTGPQMRLLGDAIMAALRHLGGDNPSGSAPDLVRGLTGGVGAVEQRLAQARSLDLTKDYNLHKVLQIFAFYQAMRLLAESLLIALDRLEKNASGRKSKG